MTFDIIPCQPEDAPRLFAIQQSSFERLEGFRMRHWKRHEFAEVLRQAKGFALVDDADTIQAYVLFQELHEAWEILHLATHPDFWGQGLMTRLIKYCIDHRPDQKAIWLEVHEKNQRAIDLYDRLQFRRGGRRPRFYGDGGSAILYSYP